MDERSRLRGCEGYGIRFDDIPSPSCFAIHLPRGGRLRWGIASADAKIPRSARNDRKTERPRSVVILSGTKWSRRIFSLAFPGTAAAIYGSRTPVPPQRTPPAGDTHRTLCGAGRRNIRVRFCHPVFADRRAGVSESPVMPYIFARFGALAYLLSDFAGPPENHRRPYQPIK